MQRDPPSIMGFELCLKVWYHWSVAVFPLQNTFRMDTDGRRDRDQRVAEGH
jgi:hypothetical protein